MYAQRPRRRVRQAVVAFAPRLGTLRWIVEELDGEPYKVAGVRSIGELVSALSSPKPGQRPIAIVDFDSASESDLESLRALRDQRWNGVLIGLGRVESEIRTSLNITEMIARPLGSERLRKSVSEVIVLTRETQQLPVLAP